MPIGDNDRAEGGCVHQLTGRLDVVGRVAEELAGRQVHVPVLDRLVDFVQPDAFRLQFGRIDLDADGVLLRPLDLHL